MTEEITSQTDSSYDDHSACSCGHDETEQRRPHVMVLFHQPERDGQPVGQLVVAGIIGPFGSEKTAKISRGIWQYQNPREPHAEVWPLESPDATSELPWM